MRRLFPPLVAALVWLGCRAPVPAPAEPDSSGPSSAAAGFQLSSPAFREGGEIPVRHTCDGADLSPPLRWSAPPPGTCCLVLLVSDPDAPDPAAPRFVWSHWVLLDLPPAAGGLAEGAGNQPALPPAREGWNDWERPGWGGPCPPVGRHRYHFDLLALDSLPAATAGWRRLDVESFARGHLLARARLTGLYERSKP